MRLRAVTALGEIKDSTTLPVLIKRLSDSSFTVKLASMAVVASFGKPALEPLKKELLAAKPDEYRTVLIRTLRNTFKQLADADKTASLKKELAEPSAPA